MAIAPVGKNGSAGAQSNARKVEEKPREPAPKKAEEKVKAKSSEAPPPPPPAPKRSEEKSDGGSVDVVA